jgi:DNA (cytosine-5)-methyltransferase 1
MRFGSLFAGIGGMDLGLERAGMECRWQVEIDPFARKILEKHWPGVPKHGDIREVTGEELERVDLIAGGFPCTNTSNAGDRTGIEGEHSGRWFDMLRIIRALRPQFVLVENPPGLLSRGMGEVLGGLAESGYDAEWQCVPAFTVGAKHERERIFTLAYPCGEGPALAQQIASRGWRDSGRNSSNCGDSAIAVADIEQPGLEGNQRRILADWESLARHASRCRSSFTGIASRKDGASESWILRRVHGIPNRMDRVRTLGNAVVPQVAEWIGRRIMEAAR